MEPAQWTIPGEPAQWTFPKKEPLQWTFPRDSDDETTESST